METKSPPTIPVTIPHTYVPVPTLRHKKNTPSHQPASRPKCKNTHDDMKNIYLENFLLCNFALSLQTRVNPFFLKAILGRY